MDALKHARELYRNGAHAEAIAFINSDPELLRKRPLVEEIAHNLRVVESNAVAAEYLLEHLPDFPKTYPRWTRMIAHWSIGALPDERAAEICELALAANTTSADRKAMTGGLFFQMYKLFNRLNRPARAAEIVREGEAVGFIECTFLSLAEVPESASAPDVWMRYARLLEADYLSGEIWSGVAARIIPETAARWLGLLEKHKARLDGTIGYRQACAKAFRCLDQPLRAAEELRAAIALGANGPGGLWTEIVSLYTAAGSDAVGPDLLYEALHAAVIHNPSNRLSLEDLKAELRRRDPQVDIAAALDRIQRAEPRLILTIFFELRSTQPLETLLERYARQFEAEMAEPGYKACAALWDAYVAGEPLPEITQPDNHATKVFVIRLMRGATRVNIARNWAQDRAAMQGRKINTRALRDLHGQLTSQLDPAWGAYLAQAAYSCDAARETVRDRETKCCFQNRVVNSGLFNLPDLAASGEEVETVDTFYTNGRTVFTFAGDAPFILVTAGAGSRPFMLYYPEENLIVDLGARLGHMLDDFHMNNLLSRYITRLAEHVPAYNVARTKVLARRGAPSAPRRLVLNINTAENFAHHVWNFYTGLERQLAYGSMAHVEALHFAGTEFFAPLHNIFPEVANLPLNTERIDGNVDPVPFDPDRLLITLGGYFITTALQERIARVCLDHIRDDTAAMARLERARRAGKLVWFGLRTGDKSWLGQEAGLIKVISHLQARYPNVLCVLDAFSLAASQDGVPPVWQAAFDRLSALCTRIAAAAQRPDDVINLTGVSLPETILIARETDAYVTPLGTTQHKVGWFTKGPGLIYIPKATAALATIRRPGTWESEGIRLPDFLTAAQEFEGQRRDVNDRRANLFNMELDTDEICAWLDAQLDIN